MVAGEDAHQSERALATELLGSAGPGQICIADRNFCIRTLLDGWHEAGAGFIVRQHAGHARLSARGAGRDGGQVETGRIREQAITVEGRADDWRCIEIALDVPTEGGEDTIRLWSNLPAEIGAAQIAELYRKRWRVEGMFQRLESVFHSEIASLGHPPPRAALLGFAVSLLAYDVLALLSRCVEQAHHQPSAPPLVVSLFHLAVLVTSGYAGLLIALPPEHWPSPSGATPSDLAQRLLQLAGRIDPKKIATSKRGPKIKQPKAYVEASTARAHVATARVIAKAKVTP